MLYERLGVTKDATKEEITQAFRQKAKNYHPDHGGNPLEFHKIKEAYEILKDEQLRKEYDVTGIVSTLNEANEINGLLATFFQKVMFKDRNANIVEEAKKLIQKELDSQTKKHNNISRDLKIFQESFINRIDGNQESVAKDVYDGVYNEISHNLQIELVTINRNKSLLNKCLQKLGEIRDKKHL